MTKIMLVEDDNNLREIYEARLRAEGYEIVSAADGEEALAIAVREKPDLIISDVMMPKISGFDMLDILRSTPETKNAKVIMMTALSQTEDKERASKLGADRYLVKSQVTLEDVVNVAREVLGDKAMGSSGAMQNTTPVASPAAPPASPVVPPPAEPSAGASIPITVVDDSDDSSDKTDAPTSPPEPATTQDTSALQANAASSATPSKDEEDAVASQIASFVTAKDASEPPSTPEPDASVTVPNPEASEALPSTSDEVDGVVGPKPPTNAEPTKVQAPTPPEAPDDSPAPTQAPGQTITPSV